MVNEYSFQRKVKKKFDYKIEKSVYVDGQKLRTHDKGVVNMTYSS